MVAGWYNAKNDMCGRLFIGFGVYSPTMKANESRLINLKFIKPA